MMRASAVSAARATGWAPAERLRGITPIVMSLRSSCATAHGVHENVRPAMAADANATRQPGAVAAVLGAKRGCICDLLSDVRARSTVKPKADARRHPIGGCIVARGIG